MQKWEDIVLYCKEKYSDGTLSAYLGQQKRNYNNQPTLHVHHMCADSECWFYTS